jgi:hypothetical protein
MNGPGRVRSQHAHDEWALQGLPLPGHVIVLTNDGWRRGWLIARENGRGGWIGLVQYERGDMEITEYLTADHIASPDIWVTSEPSAVS